MGTIYYQWFGILSQYIADCIVAFTTVYGCTSRTPVAKVDKFYCGIDTPECIGKYYCLHWHRGIIYIVVRGFDPFIYTPTVIGKCSILYIFTHIVRIPVLVFDGIHGIFRSLHRFETSFGIVAIEHYRPSYIGSPYRNLISIVVRGSRLIALHIINRYGQCFQYIVVIYGYAFTLTVTIGRKNHIRSISVSIEVIITYGTIIVYLGDITSRVDLGCTTVCNVAVRCSVCNIAYRTYNVGLFSVVIIKCCFYETARTVGCAIRFYITVFFIRIFLKCF